MDDRHPSQGRGRSGRAAPLRMARVGLLVSAVSVVVLGLPLLVPLGGAAKYVVVPGFIGFCFGAGCILNGWIDGMRRGE